MEPIPIQLSQASGVPFYRQVVDQMAQLIRSGQLPPGTQVPSFRDLSLQLRVSLITIRRAYADLETAGLLVRRQGQGTYVAPDVESASRRHALAEARSQLAQAVTRARQMGLRGTELRSFLHGLLSQEGVTHAR